MTKKKIVWQTAFLAFLIIATVLIIMQHRSMPYQHDEGMVFGTVYNITYQYDSDIKQDIEAELQKVDNSLSPFNKTSIISKVNRNENPKVDEMFTEVFNLAAKVSSETGGAFDITVAPLVNMWGFGTKQFHRPDKESVDSLMRFVGFHKVSLRDGHVVKSDPRIQLDCSAIAKGYGCDVVARYLRSKGIKNFMIEIGGEVVTSGQNEKQLPWKIGVTKPTDDSLQDNQELQTILNVTDKAMATSGNYRNFYIDGGRKLAHTIDPHTGYPVQHSLLSSTVIASDCATADAYATSFMVLGVEKAKEVLSRHPELMAYFIYSDKNGKMNVWFSPALKDKIADGQ
ncbi:MULTISPECIES: FAD:protein FMN transferase [Prevotella]|uniref:FAD:protein FMN transferase n=1 Tax=Prevotella lacticifex TaxID=2854755 RepID=A0A9R1C846_9BACT|nr:MULTISPECIES: FAD:protein FMN transferase [Prevotella]MDD6854612.1 FAD:protein FMN transferase [Prevotella sp.]GJG37817.1 FAD:protein FMN transferase [Prevotella lacticifex]GJG40838.1 FAD:protein FMN transferase [Prevotella lacticifex]GJG43691.1 FAD:protein FMN transferase [Prevotella lacticifex]GJG47472.1 FAD:protein FMN transferase [Prevotella lacticifex]